ncbi:hypothetical protein GCM10027321_22790 [Massilia terrae]|uniref:DUF3108 domain-containing protein n=1 Tax=Massilia terrae TaxID=1811224 RepID=A0ABT2CX96_9BURK|nr:DUF3108 domain-containing protein [Massilia terrae]MCS0658586.1 DUF3108 domain-containing protein [Massilia terrae]
MSSAFFRLHRRRALVLGALIVLLHWTVLTWFSGQLGHRRVHILDEPELLAELLPTPPKPLPPPEPLPLPLRSEPLPPRRPPPPPVQVTLAPTDPAPPPAAEPGDQVQGGAGPAAPVVQSAPQAAPAPAPAPAAPPVPGYRVDLPPSAEMTMDVDRIDADGTHWTGDADFIWKLGVGSYRMQFNVGIRLLFAHVNLLELTSEGKLVDSGFAPVLMTEKRRGRSMTATHFNRPESTITFSASQNKYALVAGAQDKASVPLQLAAIARADPGQLKGGLDILVGEDRDATVYHFMLVGEEDIDTKLGKLHVWHLSRPPKPGSYNSRLDIWLAPERGWYPVRIRNTEASGAVTSQTTSKILMTGS